MHSLLVNRMTTPLTDEKLSSETELLSATLISEKFCTGCCAKSSNDNRVNKIVTVFISLKFRVHDYVVGFNNIAQR
jgi:hypothetical protein